MFTRDHIEEIKKKLIMLGTKDTQFPDAHKLNGEEIIAIVQDGENRKIPLSSIIGLLSDINVTPNDDFINVSKDTTGILTLDTAVSKVVIDNRKLGQVITFKDSANSWAICQFTGSSLDNWGDTSLWKSISGIDELKSQADTNTSNIESLNTEVSALQSKVDVNTTSISQINNTIADHEESISQINTKLEEHNESINAKITTDRISDGAVTIGKLEPSIQSLLKTLYSSYAESDLADGYYTLNSVKVSGPHSATGWKCIKISVTSGDKFTLTTRGSAVGRAYAFAKYDGTILQVAEENAQLENEEIIAPSDSTYLYVNFLRNYVTFSLKTAISKSVFQLISEIKNDVAKNALDITNCNSNIVGLRSAIGSINRDGLNDGYYNLSGTTTDLSPIAQTSWKCYSLAVKKDDTFYLSTSGGDNARAFAFTDSERVIKQVAPASTVYTNEKIVAPNDGYLFINCHNKEAALSLFSLVPDNIFGKLLILTSSLNETAASVSEYDSRIRVLEEETTQSKKYTNSDMYTDDEGKKNYYYALNQGVGGIAPENPVKFTNNEDYWGCIKIPVVKGQVLTISTIGGSAGRAYALTDKNRKILVVADAGLNTETTPIELVVQEYGFLYVNCTRNVDTKFYVISKVPFSAISDHVDNLDDRVSLLESEKDITAVPKISNPPIDIRKDVMAQLRVLDIGNSFSGDPTSLLSGFISAVTQGIDISNMCFYTCARGGGSFKTFYDSWHNQDTYGGTTEPMCHYGVNKLFGGLSQPITGADALAKMHSCFTDAKWDMIIIHQVSTYSGNYDIWEGNTDGGYLKEFIRIIKLYQPQATIGFLMSHASFSQSPNGDTSALYSNIAKSIQKMHANYGIDFIIPVATAVENLRASEALKTMYPNVTKGYSRDAHHLGYGLARYVANATYFQSLLGKRYGVSVFGNAYRYSVTSDEKESATYPEDCIDVTNSNATLAQLCAINACNEMYNIVSPDNILATIE